MSTSLGKFRIVIEHLDGYEFRVRFDEARYADLYMDEPPPLGHDTAPNPARILAAAIGDCLAASLMFCMQRAQAPLEGLSSEVDVEIVRNERGRLRIGSLDVTLRPRDADPIALEKCRESFEDFCVVTQSVRQGIEVRVAVEAVLTT